MVYKILINKLEISNFSIKNNKLLNLLIFLNKYKNPILLSLIRWDLWMYQCIKYINNKKLNFVIYILCILIINPIKIFHFKLYKVLWIWKDSRIQSIVLNRMLGLILSVLIFANLIIYIKTLLNISLIMIIYLYLLIISVLCELIETRNNRWLNIFLVNDISTRSILANRHTVNILSVILKKSNIDETSFYMNESVKNIIEKFKIGYTYYIIDSLKHFENKPKFWVYFNLKNKLEIYLALRIDTYMFFKYYEWNVPDMNNKNIMQVPENFDINKLREIYEYDYKVFKVLLFLYWDLEYYLEGTDYVKNTLMVDSSDLDFLSIRFNISTKSELQFLNKIRYKDLDNFWDVNWFDIILEYDVYSINNSNIMNSKLKDKFYNMVSDDEINNLKEVQSTQIDPLYYENYIKGWYEEWKSEINKDLNVKYKEKIRDLDLDYRFLIKLYELDKNV